MKISQILNNHVALAKKGSNEVVIYSKGIAFKKKAGDEIQEDEIEKVYVLDSHDKLEHFSYLLTQTKENYLQIINQLIAHAEEKLVNKVPDYLYLVLLDHLDFAIKRIKENNFIKSPLHWEIKNYYPDYYQLGLYAVGLIEDELKMEIPDDEAVSFALHFVNLENNESNIKQTIKTMETIRDILGIIKYHYQMEIDEESLNYSRLVTHIQFFVTRLMSQEIHNDQESELSLQIKKLYPKAYECVKKIRMFIKNTFEQDITSEEESYLILHIQRVMERDEGKE